MKTKLFSLLRVAVSLIFILLLIWAMKGNWSEIAAILKNIDKRMLITGSIFFLLSVLGLALRLMYLLKANNCKLKYGEVTSLTFIGFFFNNFLPTSMGGDIVKAYYAAKKTANKLTCFATVAMDRIFGFFTLFILGGIAALITMQTELANKALLCTIFTILAVMMFFFMLMWNRKLARVLFSPILIRIKNLTLFKRIKLEERVRNTYETFNNLRHKKVLLTGILLTSCLAQFVSFSAIYFWSRGVGSLIPIWIVFLTMPLIAVASAIPSINGLGVREMAIVIFLGPYIGKENAFAIATLWLFMLFVLSLIGGLNYTLNTQFKLAAEGGKNG